MLDFVLKKELPKENPYSVLGMSGAGRKGPAHIGVLVRLEEAVLKGEIPDFDIVLGKSSGAMVLAASESIIAERNANPYSGKSIEGAARQIEKILNENQDMYRMLSLWDMLWHPGLRGYVKKAPLKAFFRKIVGDKTFIDLPRLRIVVHNLNLNNDIIFGYRKLNKKMPLVLKFGNWFIGKTIKLLYGVNVKDSQCGYRAFTKDAYKKIRWSALDYSMESEMIAKAGRHNLRYGEVPIQTIYSDKYKGTTIIDGVKIVMNMLLWRFIKNG